MSQTPVIKWLDTGLSAPKEPDILAGRLNDFDQAFGGGLNKTNLSSPQGQLSMADAVILGEYNDIILKLVNEVDPRFASGFMQDAIGQIYFLSRKPATATVVNIDCNGAQDTVIPIGALVKDLNGEVYQCTVSGQIQTSGTITLPFENIRKGALACPANTANRIYDRQGALGWESCNNASDGVIGSDVESRDNFEARRNNSVFLGGLSSLDSAYANVFNVANVTDVFATQNLTDTDITIGSSAYVLHPKEVYIAVLGGSNLPIAQAIYAKLTGTTLVGNTSVSVKSTITGQTNTIKFNRPTSYTIKFSADIKNSTLLPSNTVDLVKQSIIDSFNGKNGFEKARIGSTIYAAQYYSPIAQLDSNIKLLSLKTGHTTANLDSIEVGIDQYPATSLANITVNLI